MSGRIGKCRHGESLNIWCERCRGITSDTPPHIAEAIEREQEMVARLMRQEFASKFPRLARLMYGEEA